MLEAVFVIFLGVLVITAFEYNERARLIPLLIGIPTFAMAAILLAADTVPALGARLSFVCQKGIVLDASAQFDSEGEVAGERPATFDLRTWRGFLWLGFFLVLLRTVSYLIAVPVFIFLIMKLEAKENWTRCILTSLGTGLFVFLLFKLFLQATF